MVATADIKDYFVWNIHHYQNLIGNILGGIGVRVMSIKEILGEPSRDNTRDVITVNFSKIKTYAATTLLPLCLNSYTIITRWLERPERNPNEFHNWSKLSLAHIEFAGLIIMLSQCLSHLTILVINRIVNSNYSIYNIPSYFQAKFFITIYITLIISNILKLIIFWKISNIVYEELELFVNNEIYNDGDVTITDTNITYTNITYTNLTDIIIYNNDTNFTDTNLTDTNLTDIIIYNNDTKFGQLDHMIFLLLGISYYIGPIPRGITRLFHFESGAREVKLSKEKLKEKLKTKNISIYDPYSIRRINYNIQNIGKFSLLRIMIWGKREIPIFLENKLKKHVEKVSLSLIFSSVSNPILMFALLLPLVGFILFLLLFAVSLSVVTTGLGIIGLIIKVNQVSFVGEIELLDWKYSHWIQFAGFLNNMLGLDTSKENSFNSILTFLFAGEDAIEDEDEKESKEAFLDALTCYSLTYQGVLNTLMIIPQIGTSEIQKIFIYEKTIDEIKDEEEINDEIKDEEEINEDDYTDIFNDMPKLLDDY
tara:strand:- start:119 stop:1732 length:1614 start_codon:yes stop_codon:yes gene_type:complete